MTKNIDTLVWVNTCDQPVFCLERDERNCTAVCLNIRAHAMIRLKKTCAWFIRASVSFPLTN